MVAPRAGDEKDQDKPPSRHVHVSTSSTHLLDAPGLPEGLLPFGNQVACRSTYLPKRNTVRLVLDKLLPFIWAAGPHIYDVGLDLSVRLSGINNGRNHPPHPGKQLWLSDGSLDATLFGAPDRNQHRDHSPTGRADTIYLSSRALVPSPRLCSLDHMSLLTMRAVGSTPLGYLSVSGVS
ncbi:hypothetical protein CDEST_03230 [Colletotrichum destructivum]|uniref:Uncharacterized protein n=1 Tax=Colletotrichum destructivum TaxID=34406 RepID=A0AAX4I492_9PEZI|nr:hypothetical protein CDEST_03230 [Colletotrichum destructivum]